jgi:transposase InsO family protein
MGERSGPVTRLQVTDLFFRSVFAFFIIELRSRKVIHVGVTRSPTDAWTAQQLREATPYGQMPKYLIRDHDSKFGPYFARVAATSGIKMLTTPYHAPRANGICERFLGSVRRECLDHLLILHEKQLHRVLRAYVNYFNLARPIKASSSRFQTGKLAAFHQISIVLESARFRSWVAYITITEEWPERSIPEQNYLERVHSKSHRILQHLKETSFLPTLIEGEERPRMLLHDRCQPTKCSCIPSSLLARFRENAEIKSNPIHFTNGCTK